jgi:hypothetical protein
MLTVEQQAILDDLCLWVADGMTLRDFCRQEGKPSKSTIYRWKELAGDEYAGRFARARDEGFDAIAEECLSIADDATNDWMEKRNKDGDAIGWAINGDHVNRSRLRIETRLKLLAKWHPTKYGDQPKKGDDDTPREPDPRFA